jgi:uroporphyrinogen decarboxylase
VSTKPSSELSRREAVRTALSGQWPGRLLRGELVIDDAFVRDFVGLAGEAIPWGARRAVLERLDHDLVVVSFSRGWGSPDQPDPEEATFLLGQWRGESDLFTFALIDGPFSAVARAWGWEGALLKLAEGGSSVQRFLADAVVELAERGVALASQGADGILIGDDIAYRRGTYVDPRALRRLYFPYLTLLVESLQLAGLPVVFHSDGSLWVVLDDLLATGIDGLQGMEPGAGMSMAGVRERAGPGLCLWGNVDVGWLAQAGSADQVVRSVSQLVSPLLGTPLILGTSGGLMAGLPGELVEAMVRAA